MSKTFTSRPGVTNTRGRGRGTQTRQMQPVNANNRLGTVNRETGARPRVGVAQPQTQPAFGRGRMAGQIETGEQTAPEMQESSAERRMTYQGGYSMIAPNEKKRQEINQMAQRGTEIYEAHKQQNTPSSFSYVGTAGGGQTHAEARRKLVQESPSKTQKLLQKDQRKTYFKQKDEEEIQKKKDEQRKKAELNDKRRIEGEAAADRRWDNQRKVTNDAFLRRIENQSKRRPQAQAIPNTPSSTASLAVPGRFQGTVGPSAAVTMATDQYSETDEEVGVAEDQRVSQLSAIFPQYSRRELLEILKQVNFSLDSAVAILQD